VIKKD